MTEDEHSEMENRFRLSNGRQILCVVVGGVFILKSIGGAVIYGSVWMLCAQTPTAACLNPWLYMPWSLTSIFRSGIHDRLGAPSFLSKAIHGTLWMPTLAKLSNVCVRLAPVAQ